ncbi:DNA polymerase III subunit gamma and tau [Arthrobacter koreensis]|uniref:DNA polymerase III subunit gamma and tau n=1 Tax=Arthrobacter koreensis TaxID=199136 RepID=UPI000AEF2DFF|nr:DNA polymerase III subunit gamma and tau [Arthrobacter koreensis]
MSTALYRRYRPESFADVIGQEHVTEPLMAALSKNRVNHAYLFSGPRGCGKTTSARILARCLNCAQGPTPTPCGTCDSCVELARNGAGSLDVIEIDAASHGGVDDARDLRERATFAPVRDRYKIFIIDEAHMVTSAGFNALLKIVEEPPEHIKFIFATTEPDKVIGTIRSRTHHYPFRLVPPEPLLAYLEKLCVQEGVPVAPGVLSLVIRAGGGSVRDSLSVLDQLMAGAGETGLDYELAVNLLGYTHVALLDDVVDAFAAGDAATVFSAIDRVIQTGQDPRRFVEDLLERFRDLIVVNAMPDAAAAVLRGVPEDQINRMRTQAAQFGGAELSRAADITNTALTEMTGATSPRLHLELLCARILLPAADQSERGTAARVDRIERRLSYAGDAAPGASANPQQRATRAPQQSPAPTASQGAVQAAPTAPVPGSPAAAPAAANTAPDAAAATNGAADWGGTWATPAAPTAPATPSPNAASGSPARAGDSTSDTGAPSAAPSRTWDDVSREAASQQPQGSGAQPAQPEQSAQRHEPKVEAGQQQGRPAGPVPDAAPSTAANPQPSAPAAQAAVPASAPAQAPVQPAAPGPQDGAAGNGQAAPAGTSGPGQVEMIRRAWPEIMDALTSIRRATWLNVSKNASPRSFDGRVLELAFSNPGAATNFNRPDHLENLRKAIHQVLGVECQVNAVHDSSASAGEPGPKAGSRLTPPAQTPAQASTSSQFPAAPPVSAAAGQAHPAAAPAPGPSSAGPASAGSSSAGPGRFPAAPVSGGSTAPVPQDSSLPPAPAQQDNRAHKSAAGAPARSEGGSGNGSPTAAASAWNIPPSAPARSEHATAGAAPSAPQAPAVETRTQTRPEAGPLDGPASNGESRPAGPAAGPANGQPAVTRNTAQQAQQAQRTQPAPRTQTPSTPRSGAPLPEDWPQEPSEPADVPESNAWETTAVPDDIHVSSAVSDEEWASTNWAGTTATRPGAAPARESGVPRSGSGTPIDGSNHGGSNQGGSNPAGSNPAGSARATAPQPAAHGASASYSAVHPEAGTAGQTAPGAHAAGQNSNGTVPPATSPATGPAAGSAPAAGAAFAAAPAGGTAAPAGGTAAPGTPQGAPGQASQPEVHRQPAGQKLSRYQQLLNEAAQRGGTAPSAAARGKVDLAYVEDVPSADDVTLEDSGLVGRKAIERILGGRLIEERSLDGHGAHR